MQIPIPVKYNDVIYNNVEFKKPTPQVLAETSKDREKSAYHAIQSFLTGCIVSFSNQDQIIEDKSDLKKVIRWLPFKSAEYISIQIMVNYYNNEDGIEGVYNCPRCGHKIICELIKEDNEIISDTRDFIKELQVDYMENYSDCFIVELDEPVKLQFKQNNKDEERSVNSLEIKYPCLQHLINVNSKISQEQRHLFNFNLLSECLVKINGTEIEQSTRNIFGVKIFSSIPNLKDFQKISKKFEEFGMSSTKEKNCPNCGKKWQASIQTSNFFDSALAA